MDVLAGSTSHLSGLRIVAGAFRTGGERWAVRECRVRQIQHSGDERATEDSTKRSDTTHTLWIDLALRRLRPRADFPANAHRAVRPNPRAGPSVVPRAGHQAPVTRTLVTLE